MKKIVVDPSECMGCNICELMCEYTHECISNPRKSRIKVVHQDLKGFSLPIMCKLCEERPCINICPSDALYQDSETGAVMVKESQCTGCGLCMEICPLGAIFLHPDKKVVAICNLCEGDPECVQNCPTDALDYTTLNKGLEKKRHTAAKALKSSFGLE